MTEEVLDLTQALIARPSQTPDDQGCQALIGERLAAAGFTVEECNFGEVSNLWATHGSGAPVLCFAGHTDVVPPGPLKDWQTPPFEPTIRDGVLYGRGAADMKSGVAAMVVACERFVRQHPDHAGTVALLITSDEEGPAVDGTVRVLEMLHTRGQRFDWCLVGEATSDDQLGDAIRVGRRGSLTGLLKVSGVQGHTAYPHLAKNPIHAMAPALQELIGIHWDDGSERFPPSTFQFSNLNAGTGANNVIPAELSAVFNLRFTPQHEVADLQQRILTVLDRHELDYELRWRRPSLPYLSEPGALTAAVQAAVRETTGCDPDLSTRGGTSDGRFFAPLGAEVIELGPVNASIHKINECVRVADLEPLALIYGGILSRLLAAAEA